MKLSKIKKILENYLDGNEPLLVNNILHYILACNCGKIPKCIFLKYCDQCKSYFCNDCVKISLYQCSSCRNYCCKNCIYYCKECSIQNIFKYHCNNECNGNFSHFNKCSEYYDFYHGQSTIYPIYGPI